MIYRAVIFDLFGTLVDNFYAREYESVLMQMASVLAVPYDDLARLWFDTSNERSTGIFQNTEANIEYICRELRVHMESTRIKLAAQVRFEYVARSMIPRAGAIDTKRRQRINAATRAVLQGPLGSGEHSPCTGTSVGQISFRAKKKRKDKKGTTRATLGRPGDNRKGN